MAESDCYRDCSFELYLAGFRAAQDSRQINSGKGVEALNIVRVRKEGG